jgi:serine/threonine protein kinase
MELVAGPTLAERIQHGPIPVSEALEIAREIAAALDAAHKKNIVHGDLKPRNVMLTESGHVKVLDFGLARMGEPGAAAGAKAAAGTPAYMSPEQTRGGPVDRRADIWAFGAVLFEMLTGTPLKRQTSPEVPAPLTLVEVPMDRVPKQLRALLQSCLEKDPQKRLSEIGAAARILDRVRATLCGRGVGRGRWQQ